MRELAISFCPQGILPAMGGRNQGYGNSRKMTINKLVQQLCKEEGVGFMDLWSSFVAKEGMYMGDGLHVSGKVLAFLLTA